MNSGNQVMHTNWLVSFTRDVAAAICSWLQGKPTKMVKPIMVLFVCLLSMYSFCCIFKGIAFHDHFTTFLHPQSPQEEDEHKFTQKIMNEKPQDDDKQLEGLHPAPAPAPAPTPATGGLSNDENSCMSRYQSNLYRRTKSDPRRRPSSHLISKLRKYEKLHKHCGPNTLPYNLTLQDLTTFIMSTGSDHNYQEKYEEKWNNSAGNCNYIIWSPIEGLGNRMLTLATTFLYALLTNRVLLIGDPGNLPDLFCEPFPEVSWLLPSDFPIRQFPSFNYSSPLKYGNLTAALPPVAAPLPPMVYIHLVHDYDDNDKLFFCDEHQTLLQHVPWLILKSDLYFVPSLFSIPSFQKELNHIFPEKETVFHHLGRYLFHPSNSVWGLITRYYETYLAKADQRLGIQVRVFEDDDGPFNPIVLQQILECTITKENLLPDVILTETYPKPFMNNYSIGSTNAQPQKRRKAHHHHLHHVAVMVTSLKPGYYEEIKQIYWYHATVTGETIAVFQPSHEEFQQSGDEMHDRIALAEMYLLSMSDKLVTSAQSTFGYVAQSLGGLRPWILNKPLVDGKLPPNPPCQRALSMEPCFHYAPANYYCRGYNHSIGISADMILPYVRRCEDVVDGLKVFDN